MMRFASAGFDMGDPDVNGREAFRLRDIDQRFAREFEQREESDHQNRHAKRRVEQFGELEHPALFQPAQDVALRMGELAPMLGVSVDTLRRWEGTGRLATVRSAGGQRLIEPTEVSRVLGEKRRSSTDRPIVAQSARNRFPGIITRVQVDTVAAVVEVMSGPHRLVSLMTAEAVEELGLKVGDEAVCVVKATNVIVEIPSSTESRA